MAIFTFIFVVLIRSNIANYSQDITKKSILCNYRADYKLSSIIERRKNNDFNLYEIKRLIEEEPYYSQNTMYEIYWGNLIKNENTMSNTEFKNYVRFGIKTFKDIPCEKTWNYNTVFRRTQVMANVVKVLESVNTNFSKDAANEIRELIKEEYKHNISNFKDTEKNQLSESQIQNLIEYYQTYLKEIQIDY